MSITLLKQVHGEIRRLSIAGSAVAPGDFRLKKLVPGLEQARKQAPVFAKVAQGVNKLLESEERTSAEALLEVSTLVNAVLYTQGETDVPGELSPIESVDLGTQRTRNSARVLKPLLESLTTTGSGRVETVKEACERGLFQDLRLVGPALAAIDDPYPEIADMIAERVLPLYGRAIVPELREKFDVAGRGGQVRRLLLLNQLDPPGTRELVLKALEEGSKEMKVAAIGCLGDDATDLTFLLEQAKARAADVRTAAFQALAKLPTPDAVASLRTAVLGNDLKLAVEPVRNSRLPQVLAFTLEETESQWNKLVDEDDKAKQAKLAERLLLLLECLRGRDDLATGKLLINLFAARSHLADVKSEPGGKDVEQRLISIMATGSATAQSVLVDAHADLEEEELAAAFVAAVRSRDADNVFRIFSPYLEATGDVKKKKNAGALKRVAIAGAIRDAGGYRFASLYDASWHADGGRTRPLAASLDPRWLDVAVKAGLTDVVQMLARPGHAGAIALLKAEFDERFGKGKDAYELGDLLRTMVKMEHPAAATSVVAAIEKHAAGARGYMVTWIIRLIPELPKSALPLVEALQTKLPEKIVDELIDAVAEWKQRP